MPSACGPNSSRAVSSDGFGRRTAGEVVALAQAYRDDRLRARHRQQARCEAEQDRAVAAVREQRLATLATRQEQAWRQVEDLIEARKGAGYDAAVALLQDLGEISRRDKRAGMYQQRVAQLRHAHRRKTTLINRLNRADLGRIGSS